MQPEQAADGLTLTLTVGLRTTQSLIFFKTVRVSESQSQSQLATTGWYVMYVCVLCCVPHLCARVSKHFTPLCSHKLEAKAKATRQARNLLLSLPDSPDAVFFLLAAPLLDANSMGVSVCVSWLLPAAKNPNDERPCLVSAAIKASRGRQKKERKRGAAHQMCTQNTVPIQGYDNDGRACVCV